MRNKGTRHEAPVKMKEPEPGSSYLSDWSAVLQRQSENRQKEEEQFYNILKKKTEELNPNTYSDKDLLDLYVQTENNSHCTMTYPPKTIKLWKKGAAILRNAILHRMGDE